MKSTESMSGDFLRALIGTSALALVFAFVSFLVITRCPIEEITAVVPSELLQSEEIQCAEVPSQSPDEVEEVLLFTELNPELGKAMRAAILEHAAQDDLGLTMYRSGAGNRTAIIWFYTQITGDAEVSQAILDNADAFDIPLSLAFALAWVESRYQPNAVNKNSNSSIDRGLFQLNSNSFPELTVDQFFDASSSAYYGLSHLRFCLDYAGNDVAALAMYNAGTTRVRKNGTPQTTLNYVSSIMNYRNGLDTLFSEQFSEDNLSETGQWLAMTR